MIKIMIDIPIKNLIGINEIYILNHYPSFYYEIFKIKEDVSLAERIWLYKNELDTIPICPNCNNKLKFRNLTVGYRKFCSKKCSAEYTHKDLLIKNNRIKNMLKCNYDTDIRKSMTKKANNTKNSFSTDKQNNINNKRKKSVTEKYGVEIISQNKDIAKKIKKNIKITKQNNRDINFTNRINKLGYTLIKCDIDDLKIKCEQCGHDFDIHRSLFNQRNRFNITICTICNPINNHISDFQNQITQYISSIYNDDVLINKKFGKYEIDIFLPKLKIGFECNGLWWHSEIYREKEYHINKINYFKNQNIELINIWEDWWKIKNNIIKSIIDNKLNLTKHKIYARKTKIKIISDEKSVKDFLNNNHIQGYIPSKIKIGLYYNDELISIMIFGKMRIALGNKNPNVNDWELIRYCNKLNYIICGGASKMLKYFINHYNFSTITTYADLSISNGNLYKKLNMNYISTTEPNYTYFNKDKGIRLNRFNFRKDILVKEGFDKNKTEHQIMKERNYYRIYDCGNLKYTLNKL
jgi:hypothetical protein